MAPTSKQVGFAYPSSDTAHRFGHGRGGCYFVLFLAGRKDVFAEVNPEVARKDAESL